MDNMALLVDEELFEIPLKHCQYITQFIALRTYLDSCQS
jgi:hypothetical protein